MYEIDPRFRNEDGSVDVETAMAAGRKAHAQSVGDGCKHMRALAVRLLHQARHMVLNLHARMSLHRAARNRAA